MADIEIVTLSEVPETSVIPQEFLAVFKQRYIIPHPHISHGSSQSCLEIIRELGILGINEQNCLPLTTLIISIESRPAILSFIGTKLDKPQRKIGRIRYNKSKSQSEKISLKHEDPNIHLVLGTAFGVVHPVLSKEKVAGFNGITLLLDVQPRIEWVALAIDSTSTCIVRVEEFFRYYKDWASTHYSSMEPIKVEQTPDKEVPQRENIPFFEMISILTEQ